MPAIAVRRREPRSRRTTAAPRKAVINEHRPDKNLEARRADYLAAAFGSGQTIPPVILERIAGYEDAVLEAAEAAIQYSMARHPGRKKPTLPTPFDIAITATDDSRIQNAIIDAAMVLAKSDPRWWGVTDPHTQDWCTGCHLVFPKEKLNEWLRCATCQKAYEQGRRFRRKIA